ncbi:MAG: DUF5723 family protein [Tangfeifania sp.]
MKFVWGFCFFLMITFGGNSQETSSLFLLPGVSQSSVFNPALQNGNDKLIIGLPVLSGISGTWNANSPFDALFSKGFSYNVGRLYNELEPRGKANASGRVSMFYASLGHNGYMFRLSVSERMFATGFFDRDIVKIIRDGTEPYFGSNEYFGEADFHFQHFREISVGVSKKVWKSLDVGIASKILFGKLGFDASGLSLSVETDTENDVMLVQPKGTYLISGPLNHVYYPEFDRSLFLPDFYPGDYFFQPRNLGLAVDGGVVYRPGKYSEISASLLDLGFTTFKYNTFGVDFSGSARFAEEGLYQSANPEGEDYKEPREAILAFVDSVSYIINVNEATERILTFLPVTFNLSGKYRFSENLTGGINNQFRWFRNQPRNMFAGFIQARQGKRVELAGSLFVYNLSAVRPGFGVSWTLPKFQFYFSSNNILGIIQPTSSKHLNLSVGMNLLFDTE